MKPCSSYGTESFPNRTLHKCVVRPLLMMMVGLSGLTVGPLLAQGHGGHGGGGGHSGGGGHAGGGHAGGGPISHGGGAVHGTAGAGIHGGFAPSTAGHGSEGHVGGFSGFSHGAISHGGFGGHFSPPSIGHGNVGHLGIAPSTVHSSGLGHASLAHPGDHDFSHWITPDHHNLGHGLGFLHHGIDGFHHGHFGYVGLGFGFYSGGFYPYSYWYDDYPSSYSYPYYDYYTPPSYLNNYSTNSLYGTKIMPGNLPSPIYEMPAQPDGLNGPKGQTVPDVFIPRLELPSREAPETLPEETPGEPPLEGRNPKESRK